ncbi:hypothetical protein ACIREK_16285 [Streptomyces sp. NPDC102415]|uniref:hypothetical protein n=1 Tax=Streptomyces sp. NPDC102415 TaxID=3366173 RepID=UPI003802D1DB
MLLTDVNEIVEPRTPTLSQVQDFMECEGWVPQPPGTAGRMWIKNRARIGVPETTGEDSNLVRGIIERIARFERKDLRFITNYIRYYRTDVALLRAARDDQTETISLDAASTVISNARTILRASGTTAWSERSNISGNYSRQGDEVVERARMDHTVHGPFMIPVLVPLPHVEGLAAPLPDVEGEQLFRAAAEPFARRVTRTLAQSLVAVNEVIIQPERMPTARDLHTAVERGVSREFCSALTRILEEPSVAEFTAQFQWAPAVQASATIPKAVEIEATAAGKVKRAAEILKERRVEPRSTFSGVIVELRHVREDPYGLVTVSTIRHGRSCEIRVRLSYDAYQEAVTWHRDRRAVIVQGSVREGPGRRLIVDAPERCRPIDENFLPEPRQGQVIQLHPHLPPGS